MGNRGPFQTPFDEAIAPTLSGEPSGGGTTGGFDMGTGSKSETPNMSALPNQVTTFDIGPGSAPGSQAPTPPVASPGTFPTKKP